MSVLKDIHDLIIDAKTSAKDLGLGDKKYSSLSARATEGTLQFPHIVSRNLDLDTAQTICKASERQLATFVQITMSMSPFANADNEDSLNDYIKRFHNYTFDPTTADGSTILAKFLEESYNGILDNDGMLLVSATYNDTTTTLEVSNKKQLYSVLEELNTSILNNPRLDIKIFNENTKYLDYGSIVMEKKSKNKDKNNSSSNNNAPEPPEDTENNDSGGSDVNTSNTNNSSNNGSRNANNNGHRFNRNHRNLGGSNNRPIIIQNGNSGRSSSSSHQEVPVRYDFNPVGKGMLLDNDAKKANELVSTLVHVKVYFISKKNGTTLGSQDFVIGVKAIMHPVTSEEMITNLVAAYRGENGIFDFIRWTTGEISFLKDFVLNMDRIKDDVARKASGQSHLWISNKRHRRLRKLANIIGTKDIYPTTSIVITKDEVDHMKKNYGIDLMDLSTVNIITDKLFLLNVIIADMSSKVAYIKFENEKDWEAITFAGLERENSRDEKKFKEMLKMINRF